jgi:hypothetical protein
MVNTMTPTGDHGAKLHFRNTGLSWNSGQKTDSRVGSEATGRKQLDPIP